MLNTCMQLPSCLYFTDGHYMKELHFQSKLYHKFHQSRPELKVVVLIHMEEHLPMRLWMEMGFSGHSLQVNTQLGKLDFHFHKNMMLIQRVVSSTSFGHFP